MSEKTKIRFLQNVTIYMSVLQYDGQGKMSLVAL